MYNWKQSSFMGDRTKMWARILALLFFVECVFCEKLNTQKFPEDFQFGVATSSYQVEGAWNEDGKTENIWDHLTHTKPEMILDRSNGDIASDSYHKYEEDVEMVKSLNVSFYRFSISWARLTDGINNKVNQKGIDYYNKLINALLAKGIQPLVTIFHWDTPQSLEDIGGWTNEKIIDNFVFYADLCFKSFGDRVKMWLTFNEPANTCHGGYGTMEKAPAKNDSGLSEYTCAHTVLKAHAKAYHLYDQTYRPTQKGKIAITLDTAWFEPASIKVEDIEAAERQLQFTLGWYANPIFGPTGDYPEVMKKYVKERSLKEGYPKSRLPEFTPEEIEEIKGTADFFGFNAYTSKLVEHREYPVVEKTPNYIFDMATHASFDPNWPSSASPWLKVVPWGFRKILNWIKYRYGNIEIYVTENGYSDKGQLEDYDRIVYYQLYLSAMLDAIYVDKVNVKAYTFWGLLDNFEWMEGYTSHLGLYHVDFNDANRKRTPKLSVGQVQKIMKDWRLPEETYSGVGKIRGTLTLLVVSSILTAIQNLH